MREDIALNLLYNFLPSDTGEAQSFYKVLNFFSESGDVSSASLESVYEAFTPTGPQDWICFDNLDELGSFALEVCKKVDCPEVFILSAQDYNLAIDNSNDVRAVREIFRRYGTSVENPEKSRKKTVFSKLFN